MTDKELKSRAIAAQNARLRLLSKAEAAEILGVSVGQIDRLRMAGALLAVKAGKEWRYNQGEILRFQRLAAGKDVSGAEAMRELARSRTVTG